MQRSDEIADLIKALAKAQGAIEDASKDSTNPHFKSRYADMASVRTAIRAPLSENGLAFTQFARTTPDNMVEIETMIAHESGQSISDVLRLPVPQFTPQGVGSAISYGRRYALMSMIGIAASEDDDDGEGAHGREPDKQSQKWSGKEGANQGAKERDQIEAARQEKLAALKKAARDKADGGTKVFNSWWQKLNGAQQAALQDDVASLFDVAQAADQALLLTA